MPKNHSNFDKLLKIYLLSATFLLGLGFYYLYNQVRKLSSPIGESTLSGGNPEVRNVDVCGPDCKKEIQSAVSDAIATISGTTQTPAPKATGAAVPTATARTQTVYIPLAGPVTTTSTDWVDVPGTDTYIDLVNDYGKGAYVSWDTFLSVANSNGQAFARLYDATHGIAVDGSQVSTTNNASLQQVSSGNLSFWSGRNLYRVQIKSLNSFTVTFGSGRIRITY